MGRFIGITWLLHVIISGSTTHSVNSLWHRFRNVHPRILDKYSLIFRAPEHFHPLILFFFLPSLSCSKISCGSALQIGFVDEMAAPSWSPVICGPVCPTDWLWYYVRFHVRVEYDDTNTHYLLISFLLCYLALIVLGCAGLCIGEVENAQCALRGCHKFSIDVPVDQVWFAVL